MNEEAKTITTNEPAAEKQTKPANSEASRHKFSALPAVAESKPIPAAESAALCRKAMKKVPCRPPALFVCVPSGGNEHRQDSIHMGRLQLCIGEKWESCFFHLLL